MIFVLTNLQMKTAFTNNSCLYLNAYGRDRTPPPTMVASRLNIAVWGSDCIMEKTGWGGGSVTEVKRGDRRAERRAETSGQSRGDMPRIHVSSIRKQEEIDAMIFNSYPHDSCLTGVFVLSALSTLSIARASMYVPDHRASLLNLPWCKRCEDR